MLSGGEGEPGAPAFERECFYFFPWAVTPNQHLSRFFHVTAVNPQAGPVSLPPRVEDVPPGPDVIHAADIHAQVILVVAASQVIGYVPTELGRIGPDVDTPGDTIAGGQGNGLIHTHLSRTEILAVDILALYHIRVHEAHRNFLGKLLDQQPGDTRHCRSEPAAGPATADQDQADPGGQRDDQPGGIESVKVKSNRL